MLKACLELSVATNLVSSTLVYVSKAQQLHSPGCQRDSDRGFACICAFAAMSRKGLFTRHPFSAADREYLPKVTQPKLLGPHQRQSRAPPVRNATANNRDQPFVHFNGFNPADLAEDPDPIVNDNLNTATNLLAHRGRGAPTLSQAEALENNWARLRPHLTKSYISHFPDIASLLQKRHQVVQSVFTEQIKHEDVCACPHCATTGENKRTVMDSMPVHVVSVEQRFLLHVPRYQCKQCEKEYSLRPTQLGCLPATPIEAWDLCAAGAKQVTWIDMQLVQLCDLMVVVQKRVSLLSLVEVMDAMHGLNGCPAPLNTDTFRRQLASVVLEYGYLLCHTRDMAAMGVEGFPAGPLSQCGGCWETNLVPDSEQSPPKLQSLLIDFNFKLPLLQSVADKSRDLDALPPNHKYFLEDKKIKDFANLPSSSVAPDPDKACADFHADKVSFVRASQCQPTRSTTLKSSFFGALLSSISFGVGFCKAALARLA